MKTFLSAIIATVVLAGCGFTTNINFAESITGSGNAATETREIADVSEITLDGVGDLTISIGEAPALSITADDNLLEYLQSNVSGRRLTLDVRNGVSLNVRTAIRYDLTVTALSDIQLEGLGNITIQDAVDASTLTINIDGGGNITTANLNAGQLTLQLDGLGNMTTEAIQVNTLNITTGGSGNVRIANLQSNDITAQIEGLGGITIGEGRTNQQQVTISGSGGYSAGDFVSQNATVTIEGIGNALVNVVDNLNANIDGMGNIRYRGEPQNINRNVDGMGNITPAN